MIRTSFSSLKVAGRGSVKLQILRKKRSFNYYENDLNIPLPPILGNLDNLPPGAFYLTPPSP